MKREGGFMFAEVLIELKTSALDRTFTYKIDETLRGAVKIGMRVLVPFGKQKLEGFVLKIKDQVDGDYQIKSILSCTDEEPVLSDELLKLGSYISKSTISTQISAYQTMLPTALKAKKDRKISKKMVSYIKLAIPLEKALSFCTNDKQREIILLLDERKEIEKGEGNHLASSSVSTLLKHHILEEEKKEVYRMATPIYTTREEIKLTEAQSSIVQKISETKKFEPFLLHGVTGSGKTEVYIELIDHVLREGKETVVLVPEISLTPQFLSKFRSRFGEKIAVLHSRLSNGEKYDEWRKIVRKEVSIVIGARSAVFAPFTNIGIIILDEEHSPSYKQENRPKYHAIDIALYRAKYHNAPLVLGSATPSIESYTRAKMGIYTLLELKERVTGNLPKVTLIDMKEEIKNGYSLFSRELLDKIENTLKEQKQVILLLNRRGYSTVSTCSGCGYTDKCPHCEIPLVYHKSSNRMRCHYCGFTKERMTECPSCHNPHLHFFGTGTQKLEEEVQKYFKDARVLRMDADATSTKNAYENIVTAFENGEYDILVGTQMIAKGLDFKNVDLVGVLSADSSLNIPDFRSAERTFCLLNQVAGRAGRASTKGEVIFQGFNMDHYSIQMASTHDYQGFYREEMRLRRLLGYPPYFNLSSIEVKSKDLELVQKESMKIAGFLQREGKDLKILGPTPSSLPKVNDVYSFKIILKYKKKEEVKKLLYYIYQKYCTPSKVCVEIDLNPIQI